MAEVKQPVPVRERSGSKVEWKTYLTHEEAMVAAEEAMRLAIIAEKQGYDFGYCSPGSITPVSWYELWDSQNFIFLLAAAEVGKERLVVENYKKGTEVLVQKISHDTRITCLCGERYWVPTEPYATVIKREGFEVCFP